MKRLLVGAALMAALLVAVVAQDFELELQRAIQKELVSGDLKTAIHDYQRIADGAADRAVKAKALLRLADAHRKLGDAEARRIYERILADYSDQQEMVARARAGLSALGSVPIASKTPAARRVWLGADGMGTPSADGRYLSFTDWETGDLAVRDLVRNTSRRLTNTGGWQASGDYAEFSAISPDATQVVYAWYTERESQRSAYDLRLLSTGGEASARPRILHRDEQTAWIQPMAWTPDGRSVVVQRELWNRTSEIAVVSLGTGALRTVKALGRQGSFRIALSPDGRYLAYDAPSKASAAQRDVFVIPFDGGQPTLLVGHVSDDHSPTWVPDGGLVLFASDRTGSRALWGQPVQSGRAAGPPVLITSELSSAPLGVSKSGTLFQVRGGNTRNVYSATLDAQLRLVGHPELLADRYLNANRSAVWSPDGRRVAYYTTHGRGNSAAGTVSVVVSELGAREDRTFVLEILVAQGASAGLSWFPDGRSLLVVGRDQDERILTFNRLDLTSGLLKEFHRTRTAGEMVSQPSRSPDGAAVYFIDGLHGDDSRSIARLDLQASRVTELRKGQWFGSVAVSPDGQILAFIEADGARAQSARLLAMPISGGQARVVFEGPWIGQSRVGALAWTPDGTRLLFVRPEDGEQHFWSVPASGGTAVKTGIAASGLLKLPNFHLDGRRLAFTEIRQEPTELWVLENFLPAPQK